MNTRLKRQIIISGIGALILLLTAVYFITRGYGLYAVALITLVCFYIIGVMLWFWSRVSDPMVYLTDVARSIAEGSYGIQVEKLSDDEVGDLTDALNEMSEKVAVAEKTRTDFISQVSHELRTPLTAIEGWAETIAYDEAVQGDSLRGIQIISKEAEHRHRRGAGGRHFHLWRAVQAGRDRSPLRPAFHAHPDDPGRSGETQAGLSQSA